VPDGVNVADASEIVPQDQVIRYSNGSYALFANRFRYELQRRGAGTWVDCDIYLLQPLDGTRSYLCGEQAPGVVNNAVLRIPSDSPLLPALLELFDERIVPPWLSRRQRIAAHLRLLISRRAGVDRMHWGTTGPAALTNLSCQLGIDLNPLPPEVFYPVPWQRAEWIVDPGTCLEAQITSKTVAVHLWNERIKHLSNKSAPAGSFLARLREEGR